MRTRSLTCARLLLLLVMPAASACSPRAIDPGSDGPSPKVPRDASLDRSRDSKRPELDVLPADMRRPDVSVPDTLPSCPPKGTGLCYAPFKAVLVGCACGPAADFTSCTNNHAPRAGPYEPAYRALLECVRTKCLPKVGCAQNGYALLDCAALECTTLFNCCSE
ncbi:MAG: hypothetical protein KC503_05515 [Myxococcales bacterium]|nr:hypothetical protein [Myxococcales bacterium]